MPRHDLDFLSHLEELRRRLVVSILIFACASFICYWFSRPILDFLLIPLNRFSRIELFFQKPYEAFLTHLKIAAFSGFVVSFPVLIAETWLFIAPALYKKEKEILLPLIIISTMLFFVGVLFSYLVVIPWSLNFLLSFQTENLKPLLGVSSYFSFLASLMIAFGLLFDFPALLIGLVKLGVVSTRSLAKARRFAVVIIFIAAAVLTPSPDPVSQLLLALPLVLLFEISLLIARGIEKRKHLVLNSQEPGLAIDTLSI